MFFSKSERGFIGAIGDDLPSLIPIVIALLLFFSVFGATISEYSSRNADFRKRIQTLSVARQLKGDSLLVGVEDFEERCGEVKIEPRAYSFMAAVYTTDHDTAQIVSYIDDSGDYTAFNHDDLLSGSVEDNTDPGYDTDPADKDYFCEYIKIGGSEFTGKETNYSLRFYPVAVQRRDDEGRIRIVPAVIAMVIW